jgi:cell wall-associated NlpC family hydrolase
MRLDEAAQKYMGIRFQHQGRNPEFGIDCIGLLFLSATDCGLSTEADIKGYSRTPSNGMLEGGLRKAFGNPVPGPIQAGDVVSIDYLGATRHVGIICNHPKGLSLLHTNMALGEVTEALVDAKWLKRITGIYRPNL